MHVFLIVGRMYSALVCTCMYIRTGITYVHMYVRISGYRVFLGSYIHLLCM